MIPIGLNRPLYGDAPKEKLKRPSFRGIHVFVSGSTWDWYRPIYAGDQLFSFGGTASVVEREAELAERKVCVNDVTVKLVTRSATRDICLTSASQHSHHTKTD